MDHYKRMLRAFVLWVLIMVSVTTIQWLYFSLDPHFIQVALLQGLLALGIIYLLVRASTVSQKLVSYLAASWLLGVYWYFDAIDIQMDMRLRLLVLLVIVIAINAALTVFLRKKALVQS